MAAQKTSQKQGELRPWNVCSPALPRSVIQDHEKYTAAIHHSLNQSIKEKQRNGDETVGGAGDDTRRGFRW